MRYQLHQKVWTIGLTLTRATTGELVTPFNFITPVPQLFKIQSMRFFDLTVTEHHKVPGEWSDEKEYDGFIATDKNGNIWHNQYPRASYGQLSDSADGNFSPALINDLCREYRGREDVSYDDIIAMAAEKGVEPGTYSLTRFMDELDGGLLNDSGELDRYADHGDLRPSLEAISKRVQEEFTTSTGLKLESYVEDWSNKGNNTNKKPIRFKSWRVVE